MRIGPYETEGELGRGGAAIVYRARHLPTGALRALKVLSIGTPGSQLVERFRREAEALARLEGEGIVPVHETGVEGPKVFLAMSLMPGGSLRERIARGPLPWREAVGLGAKIARALERCHAGGIVHRDLKPENVLFDDQGEPRVSDFGAARDLGAESLTKTGDVIGTVAYMAPEQLDARPIDGKADVFALGVLLHELVSGEKPFGRRGTFVQLISERAAGRKEKLPASAGAPRGLDELIDRAVRSRVEDRPDMAKVRADLEALGRGEEARARPPVAALVLGVVLVVAVVSAIGWRSGGAPPPLPSPEPPRPPGLPATLPPQPRSDDAQAARDRIFRALDAGEKPTDGDIGRLSADMRVDVSKKAAESTAKFSNDLGGLPEAGKNATALERALHCALVVRALGGTLDVDLSDKLRGECMQIAKNQSREQLLDAAAWLVPSDPIDAAVVASRAAEHGGARVDDVLAVIESAVRVASGGARDKCRSLECFVLCGSGRIDEALVVAVAVFRSPDGRKERPRVTTDLFHSGVTNPGAEVAPDLLDRLVEADHEDPKARVIRMVLTRDPKTAREDAAFVLEHEKNPASGIAEKAREILAR